jgi:group I intron endonuclease
VKNLVIYAIINKVNGKMYIGQSRQGLARRKGEHVHRFNLGERDHKLYLAMRKYGLENFKFEILCNALSAAYLDELEALFVVRFDSFNNGYNMTCGGDSVSDETRAKLSAVLKGRKIPWAHKIVAARRRNGTDSYPNRKGDDSPMARSYIIRTPDGKEVAIKGLRQYCRDHGLDHSSMIATLKRRKKQRSHRGYSLVARFND